MIETKSEIANLKPAAEARTNVSVSMRRVLSFASITAAGFLLGKFCGILVQAVVSAHFGLSSDLDAYFTAIVIPTAINNIVAGSAITAAVLPALARYLAAGKRDEFWQVASMITNVVLLISGGLTLLAILFAAPIISLQGGDLPASTQVLAASLLVIMMPTLLLGALLNMLMATLNSLDRFTAPAGIFLALNLGIIVTVVLLSPYIGVYAVAWGFLIGVGLQVLIQIFELRREHPRYSWRINWHHPALREVLIAFVPITALSIVAQINFVVDRRMATSLVEGSVSALTYADSILGAFYMLGISLSIAVFPRLSRLAAANDLENTALTVVASLRLLIFILTPLTFLLIPFAAPTIGLLLGRGRFDAAAVQMTAAPFAMEALGLIALAALYVLQRAFNALADNVTPFIVGGIMAAFHILLNWILMPYWAVAGIALSTSITAVITVLFLLLLLRRRMPAMALSDLKNLLLRCILLAVVSAGPVTWAFGLLPPGDAVLMRVVGVAFAALGGGIYLLLAQLTRTHESQMLWQAARQFLRIEHKPEKV